MVVIINGGVRYPIGVAQYLENLCNYVSSSEKGYAKYRAQLIEQEAFRNGKMFNKLKQAFGDRLVL